MFPFKSNINPVVMCLAGWLAAFSNLQGRKKSGIQKLGISKRDLGVREDLKLTGKHNHINPALQNM